VTASRAPCSSALKHLCLHRLIRDSPVVRCVYQTDISGNKFQTAASRSRDDAVGITRGDQF